MKSFTRISILITLFAGIRLSSTEAIPKVSNYAFLSKRTDYINRSQVASCDSANNLRIYSRSDAISAAAAAKKIMDLEMSRHSYRLSLEKQLERMTRFPIAWGGVHVGFEIPFMQFPIVKYSQYPNNPTYYDFVILDRNYDVANIIRPDGSPCQLVPIHAGEQTSSTHRGRAVFPDETSTFSISDLSASSDVSGSASSSDSEIEPTVRTTSRRQRLGSGWT
ncbi:hypothetical protein K3495_g6324 [Podosphaera aphanis]|nr:hypothetical protein K3495_g6324 [Podosphaera aphanis]